MAASIAFAPLVGFYGGSAGLLAKVRRDHDELIDALLRGDEQGARDALFNFAITAYHIKDWIVAQQPHLQDKVHKLIDGDEAIGACRDICNFSKHVIFNLKKGGYRPPVLDDVAMSAVEAPAPVVWRLKIELNNGLDYRAEDWAAAVIETWEAFFKQYGIASQPAAAA